MSRQARLGALFGAAALAVGGMLILDRVGLEMPAVGTVGGTAAIVAGVLIFVLNAGKR